MTPQIPGLEQLPDWVVDMVLGHIPEGDPEAMRRAADAWSDAANALVPVVQRLQAASAQLEKAVEGAAGAAMQEQYRKTIAHTEAQIEFCNSMARPLYDNATAVDEQIYIIYFIGLALLTQVLVDMTLPPPGSILKIMADRLDAKAKMQVAQGSFAVAQLTRAVRFQQAHPAVMLASKGIFFGTAIGGGAPYLAQRRLIEEGHLKKVDWQKVKIGAAAGAVGGLVGVEVGRRFAPAAIQAGGRVLGTVAAGGVGGMAGGLAGGMTAWWLTDGALRGKDLAAMVWTGFGSGLVGSVGAAVRAGRMGAYTGSPEPVAAPDSGLASDSGAPMARVSAPGDGQPPQTHTATPELTATTGEGALPPAEHPESMIRDGHADWEMPDGLKEAGDRLLLEVLDSAQGSDLAVLEAFFRGPDNPGHLPDGSGGITPPRNAPDHPSGGSPHLAPAGSSGRGGSFPAWGDTAVAQTSAAVIAPQDGGTATPLPNRQAQISDPQVRPDQRGVGVITEGTIAQPDASAPSAEMLMDGTSAFVVEHGPGGEMRLVTAPEQTVGNTSENSTGFRPTGETLEEGAVPREEASLLDLDFEAGFARLEAELAGNPQPASTETAAPSVNAPAKAAEVTPTPPIATDNTGSHANTASVPEATPPVHAGNATQTSGPSTGVPRAETAPVGTPPTTPDPKNVVPQTSTAKGPEAARSTPPPSTPEATSTTPHTGPPESPTGSTPPPGAHSTAPYTAPLAAAAFLSGHTPDVTDPTTPTSAPPPPTPATGFLTADPGESSQTAATPPAPTAATSRPGTDAEPDADPEEFPTPPGTVVDDPRDHNVWKDPREHSVWEDPRDHSVQKKPAGDYVTIPGVSYPLEDEPPADAIPVIPHTPALTPLPVDSVGLGRAFQNPDNPDSASPRPPDIANPLSDRHVAAPETGLDAGLDKPPASLTMPSRYATEPNPGAPGAPQTPAGPHLNPHSLEYHQDPSRLPAVGGVPHLQPVPQPSGKTEHKRLIAQMGGGDKPRRRKKQPAPEPEPTPTPPQPTPEPPAPTPKPDPRPKPRKRGQPSTPPVPEQLVEREGAAATGAVGAEGQRASTTARDGSDRKRPQSGVSPEKPARQSDQRSLLQRAQQGDPEAFNSLREQYGLDTLHHVRRALGVSESQSTDQDEQLAQAAGAINGTVFRFADQQRWPVPAGEDVGSWLRRVADDAIIQSGVLEGMPDTAAESATPTDLQEISTGRPIAIESGNPAEATTDVRRPAAPVAQAVAATSESAIGPSYGALAPDDDNATLATPDDQFGDAANDQPPVDNSLESEQVADQVVDAMRQAAEAVLANYYARSAPDIPEPNRLNNIPAATLAEMLRSEDPADATAAVIEVIRRGEDKILRWTQVAAVTAMRRVPVNMDAGEGKSLVFLAHAIREAIEHGAVQVITTRDNLANREVARYVTVLAEYGIDVVRMNPDHAPRPPEPGRPTIYIGTQQDVGFAALRDNWVPGRSAAIDEIDEALIHADTQYILSDGADQLADAATAVQVTEARDFLTTALRDNRLTEADFGRAPGQRGGPARLTEDGRQKLEQLLGRAPTETESTRIAMAAAARWEYVENVHYVVHNDRVFIIDQTTHKVLFDPQTSSESRWNGGLAQAIEAEHGLRIRNDPASSKSITAQQLFSQENYDHVTGASGTAEGSATQLQQRYGMGEVAKVDRFHESQLVVHADSISPDEASKLQTAAADIKTMQETGRPVLVLADRNDLVDPLSTLLDDLDVTHTAVDAKWFLDHGTDAEAELQAIFDHAGEHGKVLVINMQGARGVDIPISDAIRELGGLHVIVTGRSARSRDIDIQAENRSARNGDPGSARYYTSPEDDLYALSPHPLVQTVVIQYTQAAAEHQTQPTPETESTLTQAEDYLRALVDPLQEVAALLHQHAHTPSDHTTDPTSRGPPATSTDHSSRQPQHPPPIGFRPADQPSPALDSTDAEGTDAVRTPGPATTNTHPAPGPRPTRSSLPHDFHNVPNADDDILGNLRDPGGLRGNKRGDELGKVHIAGGGFTPGPHGDDEPEPTPSTEESGELRVPDHQPGATPAGNSGNVTGSENPPPAQWQPTEPVAGEPVSKRRLLVVNQPFAKLLLGEKLLPGGEFGNRLGAVTASYALPYVVLDATESAAAAGMATAALWIPRLFELPAGYAADFGNRRKLMVFSQSVGAAAAATATGLVLFDAPNLGLALTAATLVEATAATFYFRAFQTVVRDFLTDAQRDAGNRLTSITGSAADITGQALGPGLAGVTPWAPFGINTLSYAGNLANMWRLRFPPQGPRNPRNLFREIGEGARALWQEKFLREVTGISAINNAAWAMLGLRTATVLHEADLPGWATGAVVAAPAVGGILSGFLPKALDRIEPATLYPIALANMAGFFALQAATTNPAVMAAAAFADSLVIWAMNNRIITYQQQAIPEELQGRVGSVKGLFLGTGPAVGALVGGAVVGAHGGDAAATVAAGITMVTAAGYGALTLARRGRGLLKVVRLDHDLFGLRSGSAQTTRPDTPTVDPAVIKNCA
ncbi:MFS transporter, partial [Nocardia gipuzkoensis]